VVGTWQQFCLELTTTNMKSTIVILLCLLGIAAALVNRISLESQHESKTFFPLGWSRSNKAPALKNIRFTIAVKQQNLHLLEQTFMDVSEYEMNTYDF